MQRQIAKPVPARVHRHQGTLLQFSTYLPDCCDDDSSSRLGAHIFRTDWMTLGFSPCVTARIAPKSRSCVRITQPWSRGRFILALTPHIGRRVSEHACLHQTGLTGIHLYSVLQFASGFFPTRSHDATQLPLAHSCLQRAL